MFLLQSLLPKRELLASLVSSNYLIQVHLQISSPSVENLTSHFLFEVEVASYLSQFNRSHISQILTIASH